MLTMPMRQRSSRRRQIGFGDHEKFLARVTKTLNYGKYPKNDCTSLPVTELAAEIFSRAKNKLSLDFLDVEEAARLSRCASVSPCSLVLALLYLDRLKASNPKYLAKVPSSQLFLISLMVGSKFMQDDGQDDEVNNCEWAGYAGLSVQDVNRAEKDFLNAIKWEIFVGNQAFWRQLKAMERLIGLRQGCKRGWFSYTELDLLLQSHQLIALLKTLLNISLVCMASYTASVFALLGSTMLVAQIPGLVEMGSSTSPASQRVLPVETLLPSNINSIDDTILNCLSSNLNETQNCDSSIIVDIDDVIVPSNIFNANSQNLFKWEIVSETFGWSHALQRFLVEGSVSNHLIPTISTF